MTTSKDIVEPNLSSEFAIEGKNLYEVSINWKIEKFSTTKADQGICSPGFRCADAEWNLVIYPNGRRSLKNVGYILLYLNKIYSPTYEHSSSFRFDLLDQLQNKVCGTMPLEMTFEGNDIKWLFCRIKREDVLKKSSCILSHDTLTVSFELTITENSVALSIDDSNKEGTGRCKSCLNPLVEVFESLYTNPRFSDVTLKVGKTYFDAHKAVLGTRSRVLGEMFEQDVRMNRKSVIKINDVDDATVQLMLRYIYCGDIPQVSPEAAMDLYVLANRYQLQELLASCRRVMLDSVCINNICDIAIVADMSGDKKLAQAVKRFIKTNTKQLLSTKKWKAFSNQKPDLSVKLLESVLLSKQNKKVLKTNTVESRISTAVGGNMANADKKNQG